MNELAWAIMRQEIQAIRDDLKEIKDLVKELRGIKLNVKPSKGVSKDEDN